MYENIYIEYINSLVSANDFENSYSKKLPCTNKNKNKLINKLSIKQNKKLFFTLM